MRSAADEATLRFVPAGARHLEKIVKIEKLSFPSPWQWESFSKELNFDHRFHRVLLREGEVIGYLFAYFVVPEIHISKIAVHPECLRQGYGIFMMEKLLEFCERNQMDTITLEVRRSNRAALEFYSRWEFEVLRVRKGYYEDGEDALVMKTVWQHDRENG